MTKGISETAFATQVEELLRLYNWRFLHIRPSRTPKGYWQTFTNKEGIGFPDYLAVSKERQRLIFAELKDETSELKDAQVDWINDLEACQQTILLEPLQISNGKAELALNKYEKILTIPEVYIWRPSQLESIAEILK